MSSELNESSESKTPQYPISEVADMTGISAFTLRYYDKCGFFPDLYRDKNKVRKFSESDIKWLHLIDALRKSGLSIEGIRYFVRLYRKGDATLAERHDILQAQEITLEYQLAEIQENLKTLQEQTQILKNELSNNQ